MTQNIEAKSKPRILFVCGRNQWRSPTAERTYRNDQRIEVRSAGTSPKSRRQVAEKDLRWANLVLVMERGHKLWIVETFRGIRLPPIESLDIPDEFGLMDEELIEMIRSGVEPHIQLLVGTSGRE